MAERQQVSPVTPFNPKLVQPQEHEAPKRTFSEFRPPQQQAPEATLSQRISNAVQAVTNFFSFSDSLKGASPDAGQPKR